MCKGIVYQKALLRTITSTSTERISWPTHWFWYKKKFKKLGKLIIGQDEDYITGFLLNYIHQKSL